MGNPTVSEAALQSNSPDTPSSAPNSVDNATTATATSSLSHAPIVISEGPQSSEAQTPASRTPSSLPPEALELASKLFDFARAGSTQPLAEYVCAGIPPNLTNHAGDTLLMLAAYHGHVETVRMLMSKGADVNVLNGRGQSPIAGAVFKGDMEMVKVLFHEGRAKIEGEDAGQPNAIDCARMFRKADILQLFGVES